MQEFGLIGYPLSHSFSQKYFTEKFLRENIQNATFTNFSLPHIQHIESVFKEHSFLKGLSVTIPYKKSVIPYLDETTAVVQKINACNCIQIKDGKKTGFNTDVIGFEKSFIRKLKPVHKKALVLGTGGASAAVQYVLQKLGLEYLLVSRSAKTNCITYDELNADIINDYLAIINCTPLGTYPELNGEPPLPYHLLTSNHYLFDLVYNPPLTRFLEQGKHRGCSIENGYDMLIFQAEESWKIWNS